MRQDRPLMTLNLSLRTSPARPGRRFKVVVSVGPFDADDTLFQFEVSRDYDPGPNLEKIRVPLMAVNAADDPINPPELGVLEHEVKRVPNGEAVILPLSPETRGHGTHTIATVWNQYLEKLPGLYARSY